MKLNRLAIKEKLEQIKESLTLQLQLQTETYILLQMTQEKLNRNSRSLQVLYGRREIHRLKREETAYNKLLDDYTTTIRKLMELRKVYRRESRAFQDLNGDNVVFENDFV